MMNWLFLAIVATALVGCASSIDTPSSTQPSPDRLYSGILISGQMAIGGEHTGWSLVDASGRELYEVDVALAKDQAAAAQNHEVKIAGQLQAHHRVERGDTTILVAHRIMIAKP